MSDLRLFRVDATAAHEIVASTRPLERDLQQFLEKNMGTIFGVRFLATEYITGSLHRGRIDSLGLDENGSPVIFEYKRTSSESVINQGLFYLDWLFDHKAEFEALVRRELGSSENAIIDWSAPRLICVANHFTRYDEHAIRQINRNIELVRYRDFGTGLLAIERVSEVATTIPASSISRQIASNQPPRRTQSGKQRSFADLLQQSNEVLKGLYESYERLALSLGDDIIRNERQYYVAFRTLRNFACVEVHPNSNNLLVYLKLDPNAVEPVEGVTRDVSNIGHFGTGDLELRVTPETSWDLVEQLTRRAYDAG